MMSADPLAHERPAHEAGARYVLAAGVELRPFGEELVLLDGASGEYYALNTVGAELLRQLQEGHTLEQSVVALASGYDTSEQQLRQDACQLLEQLIAHGLLEQAAPSGGSR